MSTDVTTEGNYSLYIQIISASLQEECHCYVVCRIGEQTVQTQPSGKTKDPSFNFIAGPIPSSDIIIVEIYKIKSFGKRPVLIGKLNILTSRLGVDVPMQDKYYFNEGKAKGYVCIKLTRTIVTASQCIMREKSWGVLTRLNELSHENEVCLPFRKKFVTNKGLKGDEVHRNGLFMTVLTIGMMDIEKDLEQFIQTEDQTTLELFQTKKRNLFDIPFTGEIKEMYPRYYNSIPQNLWEFCFDDGIRLVAKPKDYELKPFIMTDSEGNNKYVLFLVSYEELSNSDENKLLKDKFNILNITEEVQQNHIYSPYVLCCVSKLPLFDEMEDWLLGIYSKKFILPSDKGGTMITKSFSLAVDNVINKIPNIDYGCNLEYEYFGKKYDTFIPPKHDFKKCSFPLNELFTYFNISTFIQLFSYVLLGERIVLTSTNPSILVSTIQSIKELLNPFKWVYVCVPILPRALLEYLTSPFPYLLGLPSSFKKEAEIFLQDEEIIFVDIDFGIVKPYVRHHLPELPQSLFDKLKNDLLQVTLIDDDMTLDNWEIPKTSDLSIQLCFMKLMSELLSGYKNYIGYTWVSKSFITHFYDEEFIINKPAEYYDFLKGIVQTQSFKYFIERYSKTPITVFNEWEEKNIWMNDIQTILKYYGVSNYFEKKNKERITDPIRLSDLKISESTINSNGSGLEILMNRGVSEKRPSTIVIGKRCNRSNEKEVNTDSAHYVYCLHNLYKEKPKEVDTKQSMSSYKFVDDMIKMNNERATPKVDSSLLFNELSDERGRYNFMCYLKENLYKFVTQTYGMYTLTEETTLLLTNVLRTVAKYCTSQRDLFNGSLLLDVCKNLYIIDNYVQIPIYTNLVDLPLWEDIRLWVLYFNKQIGQTKVKILLSDEAKDKLMKERNLKKLTINDLIEMKYLNEIENCFDKNTNEKESEVVVTIIHNVAKVMKELNLDNQFITTFVSTVTGLLPLEDVSLGDLKSIINVITRISFENETVQTNEVYDAIYF